MDERVDVEMHEVRSNGSREHENGVHLTWEDLTVMASNSKGVHRIILDGVTGYAQPGEILAIMGPSGCGKSTLLDSLAGRLGSGMIQTGNILVNGRRQTLAFGTSAYVTQEDVLMTTLTVKEAVYYSAQLQLPQSMSLSEKKERAEMTIKEMGLQEVIDTKIGGRTSTGISGGQKRRVSICIEVLTRPHLLFLDEPTSGLDSAASYHVMKRIIHLAQHERITVLASIHQPSSEVFELFDNLCLLSSGKTVYFGRTNFAAEFFARNGFPCPPMRNPSDHFLRTINKDFDEETEIECGEKLVATTEVIDILVDSFKKSDTCRETKRRVEHISHMEGEIVKRGSQASFMTQCSVLTKRSCVNMHRDLGYYWLRLVIYLVLCLCIGTMYFNIDDSYASIQARGSMLMFVAGFLTFMSIGGFPSFVEDMKIFGKERLNGHYGVTAFIIGNTLSSIPYIGIVSIIPATIAYFLVGLQRSAEHYFYFVAVLYVCMILVESMMMIVASIVPDYLMGIITGAGIQGVMMLSGGFFQLRNKIPKPIWRYPIYYIGFHTYANEGYFKNEFLGMNFKRMNGGKMEIVSGEDVMKDIWEMNVSYSKWVDLGVLIGMVVFYRVLFLIIIKSVEKIKPIVRGYVARRATNQARLVMVLPSNMSPLGATP
ncbi:ABC transporter G family member 1-like [Dioscorea cayenensis subsp. rotundata]|uniref:ABC transporter G family member 1-like n=1 Tax=Dioscorea cayennensis subsp. rotundata TaxID=55577 RepID=A0AB40BHB2_DIOCR|nr:ABC transporter G family member 1-like [Dioscorea cayenensis subsp. rotundata]